MVPKRGRARGAARRSGLADFGRIRLADEDVDLVSGLDLIKCVVAAGDLELAALRAAVLRRDVAKVEGRAARDALVPLLSNLAPFIGRVARIGIAARRHRLLAFERRLDEVAGSVD